MDMENGNTLAGFDPRSEMGNQSQLFINLHQDIICTTKDKLQLSLQRFQAAQEIKSTVSACASLLKKRKAGKTAGFSCQLASRADRALPSARLKGYTTKPTEKRSRQRKERNREDG